MFYLRTFINLVDKVIFYASILCKKRILCPINHYGLYRPSLSRILSKVVGFYQNISAAPGNPEADVFADNQKNLIIADNS